MKEKIMVILEYGVICEVGHLNLKWRAVVRELVWLEKLQGLGENNFEISETETEKGEAEEEDKSY